MRIYYKFNYITDTCLSNCPFNEELHNGETRVGSVACQKCKYCYGYYDGGLVGYPGKDKIRFDHNRYVQCMYPAPTLYKKLIRKYKIFIGKL
jgi:hypothetical protein